MRIRLLVLIAAFPLVGCSGPDPEPDPSGYSVTVPDDVPGEMELIDKDGTRHTGNGRELYANGHKYGWRKCRSEFERGRLNLRDARAYENYIPCEYRQWVRGFVDGFQACQRTLPGGGQGTPSSHASDSGIK
jgi:hypothetical protein